MDEIVALSLIRFRGHFAELRALEPAAHDHSSDAGNAHAEDRAQGEHVGRTVGRTANVLEAAAGRRQERAATTTLHGFTTRSAEEARFEEMSKPPFCPNVTSASRNWTNFLSACLLTNSVPSCFCELSLTRPVPPPPPQRSSSRINEQAQQLMLLSSLTAAAIASATAARGAGGQGVVRSNSDVAALRPRSTPPDSARLVGQSSVDSIEGHEVLAGLSLVGPSTSTTSLSSVDSQNSQTGRLSRQQMLEDRHQELLRKQKLLQEQYTRLQQLSRGQIPKVVTTQLPRQHLLTNLLDTRVC